MGNTIIYNGQEYGNPIVNDTGVGEFYPKNTPKSTDSSNNEIFNSYGGVGVNTIESVEENGITRNSTYGHAEGLNTHIYGADNAHVEGAGNTVRGHQAHAEGQNNQASGNNSHAEGSGNTASGADSHVEGNSNTASGARSHAEGDGCQATGEESHAEGQSCIAYTNSHAEGNGSNAIIGTANHAEGWSTTASGSTGAHSEGNSTTASGSASHAEGLSTIASGDSAHAEGNLTQATSSFAHAEGSETIASSYYTHAEGCKSQASESAAHAEGYGTIASGYCSHAEGQTSQATASYTHTQNLGTIASVEAQTAIGKYNATDANAALIIGNGSRIQVGNIYPYGNAFTYNVGEKVTHLENDVYKVYECIVEISTPEEFTPAHWEDISSNYIVDSQGRVYQEQRINIASIGWRGNIIVGNQLSVDTSLYGTGIIGQNNTVGNEANHSIIGGKDNIANANYICIEGQYNEINSGSSWAHVEGYSNTLTQGGTFTHIEGCRNTITSGSGSSHAEGQDNTINASSSSHVEGANNQITGGSSSSHIEGEDNLIYAGGISHAEGKDNLIYNSQYSHIEGKDNIITDGKSVCHAQNLGTFATGQAQTVIGRYNLPDPSTTISNSTPYGNYAFIIGNGTGIETAVADVLNYDTSNTYDTNDYCCYNNIVYKCKEDNVTGAWDGTKWEKLNAKYNSTTHAATVRDSSNALTVSWDGVLNVIGQNADIQINGTSVATGGGGDVANPNISDAYSSSATYAVGAYCIYNDNLYKCNTAITVAENWTAAHWTQTTVGAELLAIINRVSAVETALNGLSFSTTQPQSGSEDPNTIYFLT